MAVLGHFEATIRVNGETAQEYDDENADQAQPATVVKYIEAISDAEFSMYFILRRTYESEFGLRIRASVDGQRVGGIMIQECYTSAARTGGDRAFQKAHSTSIRGGQEWKMPFKFLTVVTQSSSPSGLTVTEKCLPNIGVIRMEVWRIKWKRRLGKNVGHGYILGNEPVLEESIKGQAISHRVGFGEPTRLGKREFWSGNRADSVPLTTFEFKYRSKKALQELLVIPRSPSPIPIQNRRVEDLSVCEMRELIERQRRELASIKSETKPRTKREREDSANSATPRSTKIVCNDGSKSRICSVSKIEIIDLRDE